MRLLSNKRLLAFILKYEIAVGAGRFLSLFSFPQTVTLADELQFFQ